MELSEYERSLLVEMERGLLGDDPAFVDQMRGERSRLPGGRIRFSIYIIEFLVGLFALFVSIPMNMVVIGIMGFGLMIVSAFLAYNNFQKQTKQHARWTGSSW